MMSLNLCILEYVFVRPVHVAYKKGSSAYGQSQCGTGMHCLSLHHVNFLISTLGMYLSMTPCLSYFIMARIHQIAKNFICAQIMTTNKSPSEN